MCAKKRLYLQSKVAFCAKAVVCLGSLLEGSLATPRGIKSRCRMAQLLTLCFDRSRYANRKPAQTKVREREQEQWAQPPAQQAYGQLGRQEDEERGRQMDSLDDSGVRSHLTKVYATLGGTIGVSAFGSLGAMTIPGMMMSPLIPGLASLVPLFWLYRTTPDTHSEPFRGALLGSFALLSGMSTAPLIAMATSMNPMLVPMALGATTGMFGIMTLGAMVAPKGAALRMGPALFGGMIVIFGCGIGGMFVEPSSPW